MGVVIFRTLALFAALVLGGCAPAAPQVQKSAGDEVPQRRDADDVARLIAGMPGTAGSPFAALEATEAWREHRRLLDEAWGKTDSTLVKGLREFQTAELNDARMQAAPVFYPFSGPDALTMTTLFPDRSTYVMVALEPAGTLPGVQQLESKATAQDLGALRATVGSVLQRSFFITREMDKQLRGQVADGLMLPILHLLVRRGNTILGFRYVRLDERGAVIDRAADYKAPGRFGNKGVEIEFRAAGSQESQRLFYFSVNLSDERLTENKPFLQYLTKLKGSTTLLKATSYMPHQTGFSLIRSQILAVSGAVLQDDSGVPYRFFTPAEWKVQLYGEYTRPYGSFAYMVQPDLRSAFAAGAKPLALRLSYGYSKVPSNILLAKKVR